MSFSYDENNVGIKPLEAGEYEVYPSAWAREQSKTSSNDMIQMNYIVRDDVEQPGQGNEIRFDNFVLTNSSAWRRNSLIKATNAYPNGFDFGTPENWAEEMLGKPVKVTVEMETYNGKSNAKIKRFDKSDFPMTIQPQVKHHQQATNQQMPQTNASNPPVSSPDPFANNNGNQINVSDDDLPF
ncbi:DUF669 domain-containing protein [Lacticaseibacillus saniviri]|uniref:Single-stranded DNA-binding protein n=1 Tax=Lacticaseibacillus saniviri JCM 17471 = DSM 24301 TaxID=1293598 RepID=A0A0R2MWJ0_9LACO|nr:DUF669 domain-containing protein [Lacticaseibacillus saniviri]KRO16189.1 hypothetical protein IV56_GL001905 [Lacticaseibacillus saniviri JCM 17471 = DSM 24301]